jgi:hypothetical protein
MAVQYFHCTDGVDLVLDRTGRDVRSRRDRRLWAGRVAEDIMAAIPPGIDWSAWVVSVQDRRGQQVEVVPFPEAAAREAA